MPPRLNISMPRFNFTEIMCLSIAKVFLKPTRIIYNDPATIVFWRDGTKTVVKRSEGEPYNEYNAFCAALAKKVFETNSNVNRIVKSGTHQKKKEK